MITIIQSTQHSTYKKPVCWTFLGCPTVLAARESSSKPGLGYDVGREQSRGDAHKRQEGDPLSRCAFGGKHGAVDGRLRADCWLQLCRASSIEGRCSVQIVAQFFAPFPPRRTCFHILLLRSSFDHFMSYFVALPQGRDCSVLRLAR